MDFVLVFTVDFAHRRLTRFIQMLFRPIIYRGASLSAFSPLRANFWRRTILIGKTQYFMNGDFSLFLVRDERIYV